MDYCTKARIEKIVTDIRQKYNFGTTLPFPITELAAKSGYIVAVTSQREIYCGSSCLFGSLICVGDSISQEEKRFEIAVQLGHILLGHIKYAPSYVKKQNAWSLALTEEAEYFARCLLIPETTVESVADVSNRRNVVIDALVNVTKTPKEQVEKRLAELSVGYNRFDNRY